jgi:hypothetical protein
MKALAAATLPSTIRRAGSDSEPGAGTASDTTLAAGFSFVSASPAASSAVWSKTGVWIGITSWWLESIPVPILGR